MTGKSWWRRNRWALLALPICLVLMGAGNAMRIEPIWWTQDLHERTAGVEGKFITYQEDYTDAVGKTSRTLKVRLDELEEIEAVPMRGSDPASLPEGVRAYRADFSYEAGVDQAVMGCQMALLDRNGDRYAFTGNFADISLDEPFPCHDMLRQGPRIPWQKGQVRETPEGEERPPAWQTHPVFFVPDDADVVGVLLWWSTPRYLQINLRN